MLYSQEQILRVGASIRLSTCLLALSMALFGPASQSRAQSSTQPIKVGALVSVTGGGAINGFNNLAGVKMAIQEIDAKGGVGGRPLELMIGDDQSDPTAAVNEPGVWRIPRRSIS